MDQAEAGSDVLTSLQRSHDTGVSSSHHKLSRHLCCCLLCVCQRFFHWEIFVFNFLRLSGVRSAINPPTHSLTSNPAGIPCCVLTSTSPELLQALYLKARWRNSAETAERLTLTFAPCTASRENTEDLSLVHVWKQLRSCSHNLNYFPFLLGTHWFAVMTTSLSSSRWSPAWSSFVLIWSWLASISLQYKYRGLTSAACQ